MSTVVLPVGVGGRKNLIGIGTGAQELTQANREPRSALVRRAAQRA